MMYKLIKIILLVVFGCLGTGRAQAVDFSFKNSLPELEKGQIFKTEVLINTSDDNINALEGEFIYDSDLLDLVDISDGNSIINFWIIKPRLIQPGQINFSGMIPGGYSGSGSLFKTTFKARQSGQTSFYLDNMQTLLNDGQGTAVFSHIIREYFAIAEDLVDSDFQVIDIKDNYPPEDFKPIITKIPEIAGDKYILLFATQDKDSGMDHFEIKEGWGWFERAESPYVIKNQKLNQKIIIKAVDKQGNERVVEIPARYPAPWYENVGIFVIIIGAIIVFIVGGILWPKRKPKQKK